MSDNPGRRRGKDIARTNIVHYDCPTIPDRTNISLNGLPLLMSRREPYPILAARSKRIQDSVKHAQQPDAEIGG